MNRQPPPAPLRVAMRARLHREPGLLFQSEVQSLTKNSMALIQEVLEIVRKRNPNEPEFLQAVTEVLESIRPVIDRSKKLRDARILERLVEPERMIQFRVPWIDDKGQIQVNRGFRVQMNSALGQYKRLANEFTGVLTGKGLTWGGSLIRPEATGYGAVYFAQEMLKTRDETIEGKVCTVSGAGNAAQYTVEKLLQCGAKPVSMSDSSGYIYDKNGITEEKLAFVMSIKN